MSEENPNDPTAKPNEKKKKTPEEKNYSSGELWTYTSIASLVAGVIGYFIGESRGEKKSNEKFEKAINEWKSRKELSGGKNKADSGEEKFIL